VCEGSRIVGASQQGIGLAWAAPALAGTPAAAGTIWRQRTGGGPACCSPHTAPHTRMLTPGSPSSCADIHARACQLRLLGAAALAAAGRRKVQRTCCARATTAGHATGPAADMCRAGGSSAAAVTPGQAAGSNGASPAAAAGGGQAALAGGGWGGRQRAGRRRGPLMRTPGASAAARGSAPVPLQPGGRAGNTCWHVCPRAEPAAGAGGRRQLHPWTALWVPGWGASRADTTVGVQLRRSAAQPPGRPGLQLLHVLRGLLERCAWRAAGRRDRRSRQR